MDNSIVGEETTTASLSKISLSSTIISSNSSPTKSSQPTSKVVKANVPTRTSSGIAPTIPDTVELPSPPDIRDIIAILGTRFIRVRSGGYSEY